MMFSRFVLNKMIEEYPESAYNNFYNDTLLAKKNYNLFHSFVEPNSKFYLREDYGFCYNFKKIGGKILVDIKVKLSHYGEQIFTGSLYESLKLRNENNNIKKKNLLLSIPRSGNHIIRTLIEYFTELPTAGLIGVENDGPIYTRSKINFEIKNKNKFIYYKQHDLILNEKHYVNTDDEVNELIFLIRNPLEIFIREDNFNNNNKEVIPYKSQFKEVYFNNIDFYEKFEGKKLLLYYEDIIQDKKEIINKVYHFLGINNQEKLNNVLDNINTIYEETLRLSSTTNGAISSDINYYSKKFKDTIYYKNNKSYINEKISINNYYKTILSRYS